MEMPLISHLGPCLEMTCAPLKSKVHVTGEERLHYYRAMTSNVHKKGIHLEGLFGMAKEPQPFLVVIERELA